MAVRANEATKRQIADYLLLSSRTEFGLRDAIALLETEKTFTGNPDATNAIVLAIAGYHATLHSVLAERQVFLAEQIAINPPDDKEVNKAKALAMQLDQFIANGHIANAVITAATSLVELWTDTRSQRA